MPIKQGAMFGHDISVVCRPCQLISCCIRARSEIVLEVFLATFRHESSGENILIKTTIHLQAFLLLVGAYTYMLI